MRFPTASLPLLLVLCFSACATPDTFYLLAPDREAPPDTTSGPAIVVGPVHLPDYIDRPELVFESSPHHLQIPTAHRWAGSLRDSFTRVLATNLAGRLNSSRILPHPAGSADSDFRITVDVQQFHALSGGTAKLRASWRIVRFSSEGEHRVASGNSSLDEPIDGDGYPAVVAAQSRLIAHLADDLNNAFRRHR